MAGRGLYELCECQVAMRAGSLRNKSGAVSDHDIKKAVWSDYGLGVDGKPLVTDDELTTLVYRLRRSLELHSTLIRTVARFGYMLDQAR